MNTIYSNLPPLFDEFSLVPATPETDSPPFVPETPEFGYEVIPASPSPVGSDKSEELSQGEFLKAHRLKMHFTQIELSRRSAVPNRHISDVETDRSRLSQDSAERLAPILKVSVEKLLSNPRHRSISPIKTLCKNLGMNLKTLGDRCDIGYRRLTAIVEKKRKIHYEEILRIAKELNTVPEALASKEFILLGKRMSDKVKPPLHEHLRQLREEQNLKISQLAKRAHISVRTIGAYECGELPLTVKIVTKISACLNLTVEQALE